jgi:hypothetical protein
MIVAVRVDLVVELGHRTIWEPLIIASTTRTPDDASRAV